MYVNQNNTRRIYNAIKKQIDNTNEKIISLDSKDNECKEIIKTIQDLNIRRLSNNENLIIDAIVKCCICNPELYFNHTKQGELSLVRFTKKFETDLLNKDINSVSEIAKLYRKDLAQVIVDWWGKRFDKNEDVYGSNLNYNYASGVIRYFSESIRAMSIDFAINYLRNKEIIKNNLNDVKSENIVPDENKVVDEKSTNDEKKNDEKTIDTSIDALCDNFALQEVIKKSKKKIENNSFTKFLANF
jgi:hypothetical protein